MTKNITSALARIWKGQGEKGTSYAFIEKGHSFKTREMPNPGQEVCDKKCDIHIRSVHNML